MSPSIYIEINILFIFQNIENVKRKINRRENYANFTKEVWKICIKAKISKSLRKAFRKQYLELKSLPDIPASLAFALVSQSCPLFYETDLKHINDQVNEIMEQNIVKREPYDKRF